MELLIYSRKISNRFEFITRFIFKEILKVNYRLTTSFTEASEYSGPLICYDSKAIASSLHILPQGLLCETGVQVHTFEFTTWNGLPAFPACKSDADIPFDIFTASFYLVSRYEEYVSKKFDKHGRFPASQSLAEKHNFLHLPIVDIWAFELLKLLEKRFGVKSVKARKFNWLTTFDMDCAFMFRHKGFLRNASGMLRSFVTLNFAELALRLKVLLGFELDPMDVYSELMDILPQGSKTLWFIHAGKWGKYDKSISLKNKLVSGLVEQLSDKYEVGIHPSYKSFLNENQYRKELSTLVSALLRAVTVSRFHFLRFKIPDSFRFLSTCGITTEYSMGYPDRVGFRAGTCTPFTLYDLLDEQSLNVKVVPFAVMDSTLKMRLKLNEQQAVKQIQDLVDVVKSVNGTFVSIWHTNYLASFGKNKGYFPVLQGMLDYLKTFDDEHPNLTA